MRFCREEIVSPVSKWKCETSRNNFKTLLFQTTMTKLSLLKIFLRISVGSAIVDVNATAMSSVYYEKYTWC